MPKHRLLYLSAHHLIALCWQDGALLGEGLFEPTDEGYAHFAAYLDAHGKSIFSLLINVAEEGFQIETIPFLQGADRKAIIGRKLGQLFFNSPLTASLSLGYEKSRRKDERILLAALNNTAFFQPWLEAIRRTGIALAGLYSLPLLGPALLKKLKIAEERCLLLTVQDQSIRQSYFEKGELHFSRLTTLQNTSIGGIAQAFATEAHKLQQYLTSQRLIGRNQPITAHILAHPNALKAIATSCTDTETLSFNIINLGDCAQQVGLKTPPIDSHCESMFLHLLATAAPRTQFADDDQRHGYHLWQIRSALYRTAAVTLFGCLLFSGHRFYEAYSLGQQTDALKMEADIARLRYNDITRSFPPIPTDNETLRRVIDRYVELASKNPSPEGLYHEVSHALQVAAPLEIDSIDWKAGGAPTEGSTATSVPAGIEALAENGESAIVRGTLNLGSGTDPRQLLAIFNQFVDALKADRKLQINVMQQPFDIESGKSLKGGDTTVEDGKPRTFSLQIGRKTGS